MKKCTKCGASKPVTDFSRQHTQADGHRPVCKPCASAYAKAHRLANFQKIAAYDRARGTRVGHAKTNKAWRENNRERYAAQTKVGNAVRDGKLTPWPVCAVPECDAKPHAHHPDYAAPLDVVWLCAKHHKAAHALMSS